MILNGRRCRTTAVLGVLTIIGMMAPRAMAVPTNIDISKLAGFQTEPTIAVDPSNPNRLFAASNTTSDALFAARSVDGGKTWSYCDPSDGTIADGGDAIPVACCDPFAVFDDFGNLFLSYLDNDFTNGPNVVVVSSSNGGTSFAVRTKIRLGTTGKAAGYPSKYKCVDRTSKAAFSVVGDQPSLAVGPGVVWVTYQEAGGKIAAAGARVTGLGAVGAFKTPQIAPGSGGGNFGSIAVGPTGKVLVTYQKPSGDQGPATISVNLDADGLGSGGFATAVVVTSTNVGGFDFISPQPNRSVDAECNLAWDRSGGARNGRVYLSYTDEAPAESNDLNIFVRFSDNNGSTWSAPVRVNDDGGKKSQFFPQIALDQTSGQIALSWYDCRNDSGSGIGDTDGIPNTDVQYFASFSTNGGSSFRPNIQVSKGTTNAIGKSSGNELGDYSGITFHQGVFYPCWSDNSNSTGDNPNGALGNLDIYTARVSTAPAPNLVFKSVAVSGGNGNGQVDPNECNSLLITLRNSGNLAATSVSATLTTDTPGVAITQAQSSYPDIAAGSTAVNTTPFRISTGTGFACGDTIRLTLTVGASPGLTFTLNFNLSSGTLGAFVRFDNSKAVAIPDNGTVASTIPVSGITSPIGKVKVSLFINHSFDGDLDITLIAPDGTQIPLSSDNGSNGENYGMSCTDRTTFSDGADTAITAGVAPFTGTFKPEGRLSNLNGKAGTAVNGTWKLRVTDDSSVDTGTLNCWSLFIASSSCKDGGGTCGSTTLASLPAGATGKTHKAPTSRSLALYSPTALVATPVLKNRRSDGAR